MSGYSPRMHWLFDVREVGDRFGPEAAIWAFIGVIAGVVGFKALEWNESLGGFVGLIGGAVYGMRTVHPTPTSSKQFHAAVSTMIALRSSFVHLLHIPL